MYDFSKPLGDAVNYKGNPGMEKLYPLIRLLKIDPQEIFYPDSFQKSPALTRLRLAVSDCSDAEADILIPIILATLSALRNKGVPPTPVTK